MSKTQHTRLILATIGLGAIIAAIAAPPARADYVDDYTLDNAWRVCLVLDAYPSVNGVEGVLAGIMKDGLTPKDAGTVLARSVIGWCPEHKPEVDRFVARYSNAGVMVA